MSAAVMPLINIFFKDDNCIFAPCLGDIFLV